MMSERPKGGESGSMSFHNGPCEKLYFPEFGCGTMQSHCLHNQNSGWDGGVEVCKIHDYIPIQGGLMSKKRRPFPFLVHQFVVIVYHCYGPLFVHIALH